MGDFWSVMKDLLHLGLPQLLAGIIGVIAGVRAIRADLADFHQRYRDDRIAADNRLARIEERILDLEIDARFLTRDVGNRIVHDAGIPPEAVKNVGSNAAGTGNKPGGESGAAPIGTQ